MSRASWSLAVGVIAALACNGAHATSPAPTPDAPPAAPTPAAPKSPTSAEIPVHESRPDTRVPGFEVVIVRPRTGGPAYGELRHGDDDPLTGQAGFRRALEAAGTDDVDLLTHLSIAFLDPQAAGKKAWHPGDPVLGEAAPSEPSLDGRTLTYWRSHTRLAELVRVTVDLDAATARVSRASGSHGPDPSTLELLAGANAAIEANDVDAIRASMSKVSQADGPEPARFLAQYLAVESRTFLRKVTVELIGKNKPEGGDGVLGAVLTHDKNKDVRRAAARQLENWGQPEGARASLEQVAAGDSDPVVQAIAARALAKLD